MRSVGVVAGPCPAWTGRSPVSTLFSGTIQMCDVFLFAARSTSTAANSTHLPSGEGTGSPTRFSFIMSSKVKGCLACEKAGREKRRTTKKVRRRINHLGGTKEFSTEVRGSRSDCKGEGSGVVLLQQSDLIPLQSIIPVLPAWRSSPIARACCRCGGRWRCHPPASAWPHRDGWRWLASVRP